MESLTKSGEIKNNWMLNSERALSLLLLLTCFLKHNNIYNTFSLCRNIKLFLEESVSLDVKRECFFPSRNIRSEFGYFINAYKRHLSHRFNWMISPRIPPRRGGRRPSAVCREKRCVLLIPLLCPWQSSYNLTAFKDDSTWGNRTMP